MMKKILWMFLFALCVCTGFVMCPVKGSMDVWAEEDIGNEAGYEFITLADGTVKIISYHGYSNKDVVIPPKLGNKPVTSIGNSAFYECTALTNITIPDSVTSIEGSAFEGCTALTNITIPDSVTSIGSGAFEGCTALTNITIPDSVTFIGGGAFKECKSLTSIVIPESVTSIEYSLFEKCRELTSITIPDGVTAIGDDAFRICSSLTSITIPDSVTAIGDGAFSSCSSLTSITIPDSVTAIGNNAFSSCGKLTNLIIPDSVTSIGQGIISNSYGFINLTIPYTPSIGVVVTDYRGLMNLTLSGGWTSIGDDMFRNATNLASITMPDSITSIGRSSFNGCSALTDITLSRSLTSIGERAFYGCSALTNLTMPDSVTSIGESAFQRCGAITNIMLSRNLTSIGRWAFSDCRGLTNITIPSSVTSIGVAAFYGCKANIAVDPGNLSYAVENDILYAKGKNVLYCPPGKEGSIEIPSGVTSIDYAAFQCCDGLTSITMPSSVTEIGYYAFDTCSSLTSITLSSNISCISPYTFESCYSLTSITIPDGVTEILANAFYGCTNLTSVTLPSGLSLIDKGAFHYCSRLKDVWYTGSENQWDKIWIEIDGNQSLRKATVHYNAIAAAPDSGTATIPDPSTQPATTTATTLGSSNVKLSKTSVIYNGKAQKPSITVKDANGNKVDSANYKVSYSNNKNVGQASVTVIFGRNYSGTAKKTFNIVPKGTSISKVTAQKKGFAVKWKKQTKQTTGYEIQYSTNSKFKGAKKAGNIKAKTTSKSVSKLKAKKKYYVRVRTYKTVKGKKYYSGWSKTKSVVTKK